MESAACQQHRARAVAARAAIVLLVLAAASVALPLQSRAAGADRTAAAAMTGWSDARLRAEERRVELLARGIGTELLLADARHTQAERERDAALAVLQGWLAAAYRGSSDESLMTQVLGSRSLRGAADRVRVAHTVGSYQANLVRSLDAAEASLDLGALERARLISRLTAAQERLETVRSERDRRGVVAGERRARKRAAAERTRARAAAAAPAALAGLGGVPAAQFAAPGGSASAQSIDAYLAAKGSPMTGQGAAFVASGTRWRVEPRLLVAIAGAESNFGNITCGPNNAWGWACPNDPEEFATWAAGIETVTRGLRNYYLDEGRTSVVLIQQKYAPNGAANDPTGLNSHWVNNVTKFLVEQGGDPQRVGPGAAPGAGLPDLGGLGLLGD